MVADQLRATGESAAVVPQEADGRMAAEVEGLRATGIAVHALRPTGDRHADGADGRRFDRQRRQHQRIDAVEGAIDLAP